MSSTTSDRAGRVHALRKVMLLLKLIAAAAMIWGAWLMYAQRQPGAGLQTAESVPEPRSSAVTMSETLGIVIGVGEFSNFKEAIGEVVLESTLKATPAEPAKATIAIDAVAHALGSYPKRLLQFHVSGVYLADEVILDEEFSVGGTYGERGIYIATAFIQSARDAAGVERALHHEFSSFLYYDVVNDASPGTNWDAQNPEGFTYQHTRRAEIEAAATIDRDPDLDDLYAEGFVHPYGRSSRENDINTYAELLMGEPDRLVSLANEWRQISAKAQILAVFYAAIDPGLAEHLRETAAAALLDGGEDSESQRGIHSGGVALRQQDGG